MSCKPLIAGKNSVQRVLDLVIASGDTGITYPELMAASGLSDRYFQCCKQELFRLRVLFLVKSQRWTRYFATDEQRLAFELPLRAEQKAARKARDVARYAANAERLRQKRAENPEYGKKKAPKPRKSRAKPKPASLPAGFHRIKPVKADPFKTAQAVIPENVKVTVCPPMPDRFAVSGPVVGGFATMRPGQYLPADTWATRALEAA